MGMLALLGYAVILASMWQYHRAILYDNTRITLCINLAPVILRRNKACINEK